MIVLSRVYSDSYFVENFLLNGILNFFYGCIWGSVFKFIDLERNGSVVKNKFIVKKEKIVAIVGMI